MKSKLFLIFMVFAVIMTGCNWKSHENKRETIGVSIPPLKGLVSEIIEEDYNIETMIPAGYSPTNYEASPVAIKELSKAKIIFKIGVPAEENMIHEIQEFNKDVKIIDLAHDPGEKYGLRNFDVDHDDENENEDHDENEEEHKDEKDEEHEGHNHEGIDPHQWLSPKRVKVMVQEMKKEIDNEFGKSDIYDENYKELLDVIDSLDAQLMELSKKKSGGSFLIYHPSLGYLADDYGFNMITIEKDGKEATAKNMTHIIEECKEKGIKVVFYQAEMDSRQAEIIAKEIRGKALRINPLEENYFKNISDIINVLKDNLK